MTKNYCDQSLGKLQNIIVTKVNLYGSYNFQIVIVTKVDLIQSY